MTKINANFKTQQSLADPGAAPDAGYAELRAKLEEACAELEGVDDKYLTDEQYHEKQRLMATLKAEAAAIDAAGINGGNGADEAAAGDWYLGELDPYWNGVPDAFRSNDKFAEDAEIGVENPEYYGDYVETIQIPDSGNSAAPNSIAFQMTDDMTAVYAETHGRDLVLIVEYADGDSTTRQYYVIKEGAVRPDPIAISAAGLSHGVTIDCRKVFRIDESGGLDPAYKNQKMYIIGSDGKDSLYGSQSRDLIVGNAGDDVIDAGAGNDMVFGDEGHNVKTYQPGMFDPAKGGNDTIRGGAGTDTIYGGGGADTTYVSDKGEGIYEAKENTPIEDTLSEPPVVDEEWLTTDGWDPIEGEEDGTIILRNNGTGDPVGGSIDLTIPPGYTMAFAEASSDGALVITFVGEDEQNNPTSFKVKIEDFFGSAFGGSQNPDGVVRLNFMGNEENNIIDFSQIAEKTLTSQVINISDESGGDDIILGPKSDLLSQGVDLENFLTSQGNGDGKLDSYVQDGVFVTSSGEPDTDSNKSTYNGYQATAADNQIVISKDDTPGVGEPAGTLKLVVPTGYTKGYITKDELGNLYVVCVKPDAAGGKPKTIVFKIDEAIVADSPDGAGLSWNDIYVCERGTGSNKDGQNSEYTNVDIEIVPISNPEDQPYDYMIDGGDGDDLVIAQKGYRTAGNDDGEVVELDGDQDIEPAASDDDDDEAGGADADPPANPPAGGEAGQGGGQNPA